jgi:hypothetical protein
MRSFKVLLRLLSALGVVCSTLGLMCVPVASAAITHPLIGSFGPVAHPHGGAGTGTFSGVQSVAVDSATGDVFVYDATAEAIDKFSALGEPLEFASLHAASITGLPVPPSQGESEIAVSAGGANAGDVYLAHGVADSVLVFGAGGESLGELNTGVAPGGEVCGVAVDPAGDVYLGVYPEHVDEFSPAGAYLGALSGVSEVCNVAADSEGNALVDSFAYALPGGSVTKFGAAEFNLSETPAAGGTGFGVGATLAVDPESDDVFVDEGDSVVEYGPDGTLLGKLGKGSLTGSYGVAANGNSTGQGAGDVYASDNSTNVVRIYGPPEVLPITIEADSVVGVTSSTATLQTSINPENISGTYFFQYGAAACSSSPDACADLPASPGLSIGAGEEALSHAEPIVGLSPGITYHYRAVAIDTSTGELMDGPEHIFTTSFAGGFALPDGRVFEMVSPLDKNGANILGIEAVSEGGLPAAAEGGNAVTYLSFGSFDDPEGGVGGNQYISRRNGDTWTTQNITPPSAADAYALAGRGAPYRAFSTDLSAALLQAGGGPGTAEEPNPPLTPGLPPPAATELIRRQDSNNSWELLGTQMYFEAATPDLSRVIVDGAAERDGAPFELGAGPLQPVGVLPDDQVEPSAVLGSGKDEAHVISDDGSRVFWSSNGGAGGTGADLFVREGIGTPAVHTVQLDAAVGGGGVFQTASADGSKAFFIDGDLYEFDTDTGTLSDMSPGSGGVVGVVGASPDGSYVYFVAPHVMAENANSVGAHAEEGADNVYLAHSGEPLRFVAVLDEDDGIHISGEVPGGASDWTPRVYAHTTRVAPEGQLVFMSQAPLTGYDNRDAASGLPDEEVFWFDPHSGALRCVSCDPDGARPIGPALIPAGDNIETRNAVYDSRVISETGPAAGQRVFFDSRDALVPQDTNHRQDVYEWEQQGIGSCVTPDGCVYLISRGTSSEDSSFVDASSDGNNVFFVTSQQLVKGDDDQLADLYDARVGGGFPELAPLVCTGTGCQGAPSPPPIFATPSSATFTGAGNFAPSQASKPKAKQATAAQLRAQKLAKALRTCRKDRSKVRRASCRARAYRNYGPHTKIKTSKPNIPGTQKGPSR